MFMRTASQEMGPLASAGLRVIIAALFLLPILWFKGLGGALRKHWKITLSVGVLNSALPFVCFTYALLSITTGLSAILPDVRIAVVGSWLTCSPTPQTTDGGHGPKWRALHWHCPWKSSAISIASPLASAAA